MNSIRLTLTLSVFLIVLLMSSVPSIAQVPQGSKLIEFDPPGTGTVSSPHCAPGCGTNAYAINAKGVIVGTYTDANVVPHGFLRFPDGEFSSFDAPGAGLGTDLDEGTVPYSINDLGVVAGQYEDAQFLYHGFIRYRDGSFTTFEAPDVASGAVGTLAFSINVEGVVAGIYLNSDLVYHGFVRDSDGKITDFDVPGAGTDAFQGTYPCQETCINWQGQVAGFYYDANTATHGFVRELNGKLTLIDVPGAGKGAYEGTVVSSINWDGTTTGYWSDSSNFYYGFVRTPDGKITSFDIPSANFPGQGTVGYSINFSDTVAGAYFDSNFAYHGLERFPCGSIATFSAPHSGGGANQGTRASANNQQGTVVGWYIDENNLNHGFVWYPGDPQSYK
jgi:probable HAF family extracellular repeat protein